MIAEKRSARRFSGRIGIVSSDDQGLNFSFITDLSRDGAYIESEKLLSVGTEFAFVLTNGMTHATVRSHVVRQRDAFFHGGKSGIGIKFDQLDPLARILRDDMLLYLMNLKYQRSWHQAA